GMDEFGAAGALDFLAQEANIDIDDVAFDGGVEIVDVMPDIGAGDGFIDVGGEIFQERVFAGAEVDGFSAALDVSSGGVDFQVADADGGAFGVIFPAHQGTDASHELGEFK